ncbi:MAG: DUF438 domain-containing protein [Firmicutes bacterium]|nr:DUF438 domain-containing protein [Bacillota bacterium]
MSEQINNREYRKKVLKDIIRQLHEGKSVDEVKGQFEKTFGNVSATEIADVEQALVAEGLPVAEIQRLCDVHAAVFKGSIEEIHRPVDHSQIPGHPAHVLKLENRHIEKLIDERIKPRLAKLPDANAFAALQEGMQALADIELHYVRKENLFFPYLEKYGITAPPQVMWGVHDEIRAKLKEVLALMEEQGASAPALKEKTAALVEQVREMIFKEENILLPMLLQHLTIDEWRSIAAESDELGYMIDDVPTWVAPEEAAQQVAGEKLEEPAPGSINMPSGVMTVEELIAVLNTLPIDMTFVDKDGIVRYFSEGKERIFPRARAVIGRKVTNCHPPASVHVVEQIIEDLRNGRKDHEDFWINLGDKYVLIRYFAVRNEEGEFLGVLEVSQDIKPLQEIRGEKRLMSN